MNLSRIKASSEVQLDCERFLTTKWVFSPSSETGWHRHNYDYIVVPLSDGQLGLETDKGEKDSILKRGGSYSRKKGVEHNVINKSLAEVSFIEIELR
tara:strand:+ start:252 stop:542 length:291 start_codon:yes stop_codon:yes gene_type:complete